MTPVKTFFRRLWDSLSDPGLTRILLIVLPCLILLLSGLVLISVLQPSPLPESPLLLQANSVNRDLSIRILDENGSPVTGRSFRLTVRFPDGSTRGFDSEADGGSCYLVRLEPGDYLVSLEPVAGYASPEPLLCSVRAEARYTAIENIESVTEVLDVTQMSPDEIPEDSGDAPEETVPEIIILSDDGPLAEREEKKAGWKTVGGREFFFYEDGSCAVGLKQIEGRLFYFDRNGVRARAVGIDVSSYNDEIDWQIVKSRGIDFAIIRVGGRGWTSGRLYDDYRTGEYLRRARAAGIKLGVYFYSTAVNPYEAVEEASVALKAVGGIPLDYPIFIDMEYSGEYPEGRADRLSPSERAEIAIAFCETVRSSGYRPGVYGGQNYLKSAIDYSAVSRYTIWLASYTVENRLPNFDRRYDIWQFTDRAKVEGIPGDVDMNVILDD